MTDDWAGMAGDKADVRAMAAICNSWVVAVGAKLGVKLEDGVPVKTAVTGVVRMADGIASAEDPDIRLADGTCVPFLPAEEAYKHI